MTPSPRPKWWQVAPPVPDEHLARFPDVNPLVIQLLYNRGITAPDEVHSFLAGDGGDGVPFAPRLKGVDEAVTRLRQAIHNREPIAIYGDFDADGVTATALLVQTLTALGAQVRPYIPDRVDEGYGLNKDALGKLASEEVKVVVTVDCGIRSADEVRYGQAQGIDIIITDHHSVGDDLPPAVAIINAKQPGCRYPFKDLAGVGIAYKLAQALLFVTNHYEKRAVPLEEDDLLDLVALGTVADMVPLIGENRALVKRGLEKLCNPQRLGVRALMARARVNPHRVSASTIGYVLGPRLNAAGRLDTAYTSYRLLLSEHPDKAKELAAELESKNRERQRLTAETFERARNMIVETGEEQHLFFVAADDFRPGIVGLVASRLTDEFYRPTAVIELGQTRSRGSCRSIPEFDITAALDRCSELLVKHGGHAAAAGFTVENANLEALRTRLMEIASEELSGADLRPVLAVDQEVSLSELGDDTIGLLAQLEPFGYANPQPLFLSRNVRVQRWRAVGNEKQHLKLTLRDERGVSWDAIAFRQGAWADAVPDRIDVVYSLEINEWNGQRRLQLNVADLRPAAG